MCTLQLNSFKERCPKHCRPEVGDLRAFWSDEVYSIFRNFAEYILQNYDLRFGIPVWSKRYGWTYRIGKSGIYLIKGIRIEKAGFVADEILVKDNESYLKLLEHVRNAYEQNKNEFQKKIAEKNIRQAARQKAMKNRERKEFEVIQNMIVHEKYNVFHWPRKLDIYKLKQLYKLDAQGICDDVLADEIGLTLFLRCKYGKEDMERMECNIIRCHNCNREITGNGDFRQCSCGYQYSYRQYRRSYIRNSMPTGAAAKVFDAFIEKWSRAKEYSEKIILIDTLLHEFHLSLVSGTVHRPVAMNFMDGTRRQVERLIEELAR